MIYKTWDFYLEKESWTIVFAFVISSVASYMMEKFKCLLLKWYEAKDAIIGTLNIVL